MLRKSKGSERIKYPKEEKRKLERFRVCVFFFFFDRWLDVFGSVWIELIVTETEN